MNFVFLDFYLFIAWTRPIISSLDIIIVQKYVYALIYTKMY